MLLLRLISLAVVLSVATLSNVTAVSIHGECRPDPFGGDVAHELAARYPGKQITAHVYDARTGCDYSLNPDNRQSTASVFKVM